MCGLIGMAGFLEYKHKQMMKELFFLNTLRGRDSTGLSAVKRDRTIATRKMTVPGYEFIEYPVVDKAMSHADQLWIGHGRYKTTGDVNKANAHPFEVLDDEGDVLLCGAHNGTLTNKYEIERKLKGDKFDTDSEALFNLLTEMNNTKEAIALLKGAWSLTWWDPTTDSVHFLRNNERPLTYAFTKDKKVIIWASEAWMLVNAARRNGVELDTNEKGLSCYATLPDNLYTLKIPQERDKELPALEREGGYVGAPANNFQKGVHRFQQWWGEDDPNVPQREGTPAKGAQTQASAGDEKKVVNIGYPPTSFNNTHTQHGNHIRGFNNQQLPMDAFKKIRAKGCAWCHEAIDENLIFAFLNEDNLVCVRCLRDTHPKECVHDDIDEEEDFLDDDLPFDLTDKGRIAQHRSEEYKRLMSSASNQVKKAIG
jgi:predicted glutamine amidotransferase